MYNWLRYSGASVTVTLNPLHWSLWPRLFRQPGEAWAGPNEQTWRGGWLFLSIQVWIDNGDW